MMGATILNLKWTILRKSHSSSFFSHGRCIKDCNGPTYLHPHHMGVSLRYSQSWSQVEGTFIQRSALRFEPKFVRGQ